MTGSQRWGVSIIVAITVALLSQLAFYTQTDGTGLAIVAGLTLLISVGFKFLVERYDAGLTQRMLAREPIYWEVWINGVSVGLVSDTQYAAMQQHAYRDGRNALAQVANIGRVALAIAGNLVIVVPLLAFWAAVALAILAPESFASAALQVRIGESGAVATAVGPLLRATFGIAIATLFGIALFGHRFGFKNCFAAAVGRMLRRHCNTPAEGDIRLERIMPNVAPAHSNS
ncbi:hypothetical protein ACU4GI_46975 (plasmid) [Cupriavidus basilensis]